MTYVMYKLYKHQKMVNGEWIDDDSVTPSIDANGTMDKVISFTSDASCYNGDVINERWVDDGIIETDCIQIPQDYDDTKQEYLQCCGLGTPSVTVRDSLPGEKIVVGIGHTFDFNTLSKTIQLDSNGNGYLELESNDVIYYIYADSDRSGPIKQGTIEINGCYVNSLGYVSGHIDGDIHPGPEINTVIINCSTFYQLSPGYATSFIFHGKNLIFNSFDTSLDIGRMDCMFSGCSGLTSLDLRSFNTSKVQIMNEMFADCINLTSLDISSFDTSKVTNMESMFHGCNSLKSLDVSNFNTSNVSGMSEMFAGCYSLTSLDVSNFNTSKAYYMVHMFSGCSGLTSLNLSNFDTLNVSSMQFMFVGCSSLESIDLSNWNLNKAKNYNELFDGCTSLKTVYMRNCDRITIDRIKESIRDAHILDQVTIITE